MLFNNLRYKLNPNLEVAGRFNKFTDKSIELNIFENVDFKKTIKHELLHYLFDKFKVINEEQCVRLICEYWIEIENKTNEIYEVLMQGG